MSPVLSPKKKKKNIKKPGFTALKPPHCLEKWEMCNNSFSKFVFLQYFQKASSTSLNFQL